MAALFTLIVPCREAFYRKTSFVNDRFTPGWIAAVGIILVSTLWLGLFSFKHIAYSHEVWLQFGFFQHASRFLRAMGGVAITVFAFALIKLGAPSKRHAGSGMPVNYGTIRALIGKSSQSSAWLGVLGDKQFFFSENNDAFIMYAIKGRTWVVMGDPVGAPSSFSGLVWDFREECDRHNGRLVFYEVSSDYLPLYLDIGMTLL
jgi:phosphatidylglycerol lysyltransferase